MLYINQCYTQHLSAPRATPKLSLKYNQCHFKKSKQKNIFMKIDVNKNVWLF